MNLYARLVRTLGRTRVFAWFGVHVLTPIDRRMYGRRFNLTSLGTDFPVCYLTTTGRRSGEPHTTPLLAIDGPAGWMVAATNFGGPAPAWALNLHADGRARLERNGTAAVVHARVATDAEQASAWPRFETVWPGFAGYRTRAGRSIDIFVLTPID